MKKVYYGLLSLLCAGLVSCAKDEAQSSLKGRIDVRVNTDQSLSDDVSRAAGEVTEPDLKDFALTIASADGEVSNSWDSFEKFEPVFVEVGTYTVTASYGEAESEGFDALSYLGSTNVEVRKDETAEATVTCTINKAKVSVAYTDDFKKYFSSYSAYVSSSKGNKVTYTADETRGAYFVPGDLSLFLELTRQGISQKITLNPKNFTAEVKHEYRLTMDVDASTASLNIIFNDNPASEENVSINISDEALNAAPPVFTPYGFKSGTPLEVLEGETVSDKLEAYLNAPAGLSKCELTTVSEALKAQGWPEKVDLMKLTEEQSQKLTELGLSTRGLGANHDKIALIDFRNVLSHLYCVADGNDTHVFTLKATDALTKVSDDLVLNVTTRNNGFAITLPESVPYGVNTMTVSLNLEGDPSQVTFWYMFMNVWQEFTAEQVDIQPGAEANKYAVTLTYPMPLNYTDTNVKFKAEHRNKRFEGEVRVDDPELTLSLKNGDADVWATKAYLQVTASAKSRASRTISSSTVEIQYKEGEDWKAWPHQSYDAETGLFLLTGLGEGASETEGVPYTLRAVYKRGGEAVSLSEELSITTEPKAQVGNAGFEEWHTASHSFNVSADIFGNPHYRDWYLPWNENEADIWWAVNSKKTMLSECTAANLDFKVFPTVSWSSSNKANGEKSIQVATVATGAWAVPTGGAVTAHAGEIWIGTANDNGDHASEGHSFVSRPTSLSFWYQYSPVKSETFYMKIELKAEDGAVLASNEIAKGASETAGKTITLPFEYSVNKKVSSIYMVFKSSTADSPEYNTKVEMEIAGKNQTSHIGSVLRIDDIKLNYE
ncbi:DUF4493 domain-containing protein [Phocaeicola plebeius]|uniref:DUF4493 domain-containing protein n=1 Tax=Phocaeicola plebeius TaxID=310297 RepID=UPI0026F09CDD|nr:DUF4493 domain-containing protein [Phocaeicola plebeius]